MFHAMRTAFVLLALSISSLLLLPAQQPKDDQLAPYYPTPQTVVDKGCFSELGGLKAGEKMFDLGSGDGRTS